MWHNPKNYYQIYKTSDQPGRHHEMVDEVKGRAAAEVLVDKLMRERGADAQNIGYYMSTYSSSRRKMSR